MFATPLYSEQVSGDTDSRSLCANSRVTQRKFLSSASQAAMPGNPYLVLPVTCTAATPERTHRKVVLPRDALTVDGGKGRTQLGKMCSRKN